MLFRAVELISANRTQLVRHFRATTVQTKRLCRIRTVFNGKTVYSEVSPELKRVSREHWSTEPARQIRYYNDRASLEKHAVFLFGKTWPTANAKSAAYVGCRIVDLSDKIVWC